MALAEIRRLHRSGRSLVVTVPAHMLGALGWRKGDALHLEVTADDVIIIQRLALPSDLRRVPIEAP